jgi:hypothetical protein
MQIFEASLDGPVLQSHITGVWSKWFRVTLLCILYLEFILYLKLELFHRKILKILHTQLFFLKIRGLWVFFVKNT